MMRLFLFARCAGVLTAVAATAAAAEQRYDIQSGGQYTLFPSPEGPGVAGCTPGDFECAFEIAGSFTLMTDDVLQSAQLVDVDITLIGNDGIPTNVLETFLTEAGLADWLEARHFQDTEVPAPFIRYAENTFPDFVLVDSLDGTLELTGGFDDTPVDGIAAQFNLSAVVPEPASLLLLVVGLLGFGTRRATRLADCR